jgi:L-alanine-DL-glutamate epimerase-like enolase superfamily enzyme
MRITAIHEKTIGIASTMRNADIGFDEMTASLIAVATDVKRDGRPVIGYGFDSIGRYAHGAVARERLIPRLLAAEPRTLQTDDGANLDPHRCWAAMMRNEKLGGHGERAGAVGVLDMAIWDATAKIEGKPLWRLLAERYRGGAVDDRIRVYAAGGHYHPEGGTRALQDELRRYRDLGHTTIKIKVGGGPHDQDMARIEAALAVVGDGKLAVDANAAFDVARADRFLEATARFGLAWVEEIGDPLDFAFQAELAARHATPMGTGENLFSCADARNLIRYGGLRPDRDWLQVDIGLSYGLVEYLRIVAMIEAAGWSRRRCLPHAGHLFSLNAVAGLGLGGHECAPDPTLLFGGFPDGVTVEDGHVRPAELPGIGFEGKANLYRLLRDLAT